MSLGKDADLIIGSITNYKWDDIKVYVNSLRECGFTGKKAMICYNVDKDTVAKLVENDFSVFGWDKNDEGDLIYKVPNFNICVERFAHYWFFINKIETPIRYVIATDVRDVVFQSNPSDFLEDVCQLPSDAKIVASSENILYKDEPWSANNIKQAFGEYQFENMKDKEICCAGVIAGEREYFTDLCLQIFLTCRGSQPHTPGGGGPDQAALNIILNTRAWDDVTYFVNASENWACQAGTTHAAITAGSGDIGLTYKNGNVDVVNNIINDNAFLLDTKIVNDEDKPYCIVHQYNRVPEWKEVVEYKYAI